MIMEMAVMMTCEILIPAKMLMSLVENVGRGDI